LKQATIGVRKDMGAGREICRMDGEQTALLIPYFGSIATNEYRNEVIAIDSGQPIVLSAHFCVKTKHDTYTHIEWQAIHPFAVLTKVSKLQSGNARAQKRGYQLTSGKALQIKKESIAVRSQLRRALFGDNSYLKLLWKNDNVTIPKSTRDHDLSLPAILWHRLFEHLRKCNEPSGKFQGTLRKLHTLLWPLSASAIGNAIR